MANYKTEQTKDNPAGLNAEAMNILAEAANLGLLNWHIPSGEILMNRRIANLTGYELDEIPQTGGTRDALIVPDDREKVNRAIGTCLSGDEQGYDIEYRMFRRDGSIVSIQETGIVYERDEKGKPLRLAALSQDLSRLKWAEEKARAMEQENLELSKGSSQAELIRQNHMLRAANSAAALIVGGFYQDYELLVRHSLQILGESLDVDRAYIWRNEAIDDRLFCFQRSEWAKETASKHSTKPGERFAYDEIIPKWAGVLKESHPIRGLAKDLYPQKLKFPGLEDVKSVMLIPLYLHGIFFGFIGFDDCTKEREFTESEMEIMKSGALIIASSVSRNEALAKLNEAREEAMASAQAKSEFLSRMSHEIRTPINAVIGMTTIAKKAADPEKVQYCLDKVDASSRQLLGIINDVLDMSKIDANKFEISPSPFDFEKMMQNVFNVVQVKLDEKHQTFAVEFDHVFTRKIVSDELRLSQVLINLLNNAVKFTPDYGKITLKIREEQHDADSSRLHVEVIDTGIGIDEEGKTHLFRSFEQADGGITRKYGGTGLGLAICKKIVNLMGGDIWVQSQPGEGSQFIFEVEVGWGEELSGPAEMSLPHKLSILVVDDSEDVREYFHNILNEFALECDTAKDGAEALSMVRDKQKSGDRYDLIFIDWNMPGMDGNKTAKEIRKLIGPDALVVMISVADWGDIEQGAKEADVVHFLPKPILPSMLYNKIVELTANTLVTQKTDDVPDSGDWTGKKILLVEDIEINREIVLTILEETGVQIDCACNGQEAVDIFAQSAGKYDMVLMDIQMPILDGLGATRKIRAMDVPGANTIPIIAMTANAFKEDEDACLAAGMNAHVAKPLDIDELFRVMSHYLAGR